MSKSARVTVVMDVSVKDDAIMSSFVKAVKSDIEEITNWFMKYNLLTEFEFEVKVEQETMHGKK